MSNFLCNGGVKKAACVGLIALSLSLLSNEVSANTTLDNVNFRSSAEITNGNKIGETLKKGTTITPIEIGAEWVSTKIGEDIGYISAEYVSNDTFNAKIKDGCTNINVRTSAAVGDNKYLNEKNKPVQVNGGKKINIIGEEGNFYKVYIDSLKPLYVSKEFVVDERPVVAAPVETKVEEVKVEETKQVETKVEEKKTEEVKTEENKVEETKIEEAKVPEASNDYFITGRGVNFRQSNSTASKSLRKFTPGEKVTMLEEVAGTEGFTWVKVKDKNGTIGFVSKDYITSVNGANEIVTFAKTFIGTPYVSGKSDPNVGFDCSGFTSYIFKQLYGASIPRVSNEQYNISSSDYKNCTATHVSTSELIPGDIVCYKGHVAIYVGDGQVIHAPVPGSFVRIESINMGGQTLRGAVRITPNK